MLAWPFDDNRMFVSKCLHCYDLPSGHSLATKGWLNISFRTSLPANGCDPEYPNTASSLGPGFLEPDGVNPCGV